MIDFEELQQKYDSLQAKIDNELIQHKQVEEALKKSEANLKAVFDATDESIFLISADDTLLALNDIAAKRMGGNREEWVGQKIFSLLPPEVVAHRKPFIDRVLLTKQPVNLVDVRNDHWMESYIYPILGERGEVSCMTIFSRDITERKQTENALKESEKK